MLVSAGWAVQDAKAVNLYAKQGVAIREFELKPGFGTADYLLYVDGQAAGVIEAKKAGATLTGVEIQSAKYSKGLPDALPAWTRPLPFCYQSTGIETRFTNGFDPEPCSRQVFFFHKPETFADWLSQSSIPSSRHPDLSPLSRHPGESRDPVSSRKSPWIPGQARNDELVSLAAEAQAVYCPSTLNSRIRRMPPPKDLASRIEKPPHQWRVDNLWNAYAALEKSKVKGASVPHILTDLVSLVRFAMHRDDELVPFPERVNENFEKWMAEQTLPRPQGEGRGEGGSKFTAEQRRWLEMIRDHIAANLAIEVDDFDLAPFAQQGGLRKVHQVFGADLNRILEELNGVLAA
jgi:hypothetical protein